jgi:hypothetical protein
MRHVLAAATAALTLALTACSASALAHVTSAHRLPHAAAAGQYRAQGCAAVYGVVLDVARKAHINLATGDMKATGLTLAGEAAWGKELAHSYHPPAHPTADDIQLQQDVLTAQADAIMRNKAEGAKFVADLQALVNECGG